MALKHKHVIYTHIYIHTYTYTHTYTHMTLKCITRTNIEVRVNTEELEHTKDMGI